jgi:hypothetical protein
MELLTAAAFLSAGVVMFAEVLPKQWDAALRRTKLSGPRRRIGVVALSLATVVAVIWTPWLLMGVLDGRLVQNLTDPLFYYAMFVALCGPILIVQAWHAVRFVRHETA